MQEPDLLTDEQLAVRLTGGGHELAAVRNVGDDDDAAVRLPLPAGEVVAGSGSSAPDGPATRVRVPLHAFLLVAGPSAR